MSDRLAAKLTSGQSALILAALGVSAAALIWRYTARRKRDQGIEGEKPDDLFSPPPGGQDVAMVKEAMEAMQKSFDEAALSIKSLPENAMGQNDRLMTYGLYKQASIGNRNIAEPSKLNVVAHAKWTAWGKFTGLPKEVAKIQYIEVAKHFVEVAAGGEPVDENADIVYDDDDESWTDDEDGGEGQNTMSSGGMSGMGLRPSQMEFKNDSENDETDEDTAEGRIQRAALQGDIAALKKEIAAINDKIVINKADDSGQTALHFAADRGSADCVSLLLEAGANPNAADNDGISVLQTAVIGGDVEKVRLLLKAGADPDHKDIDGESPRSCAEEDGSEEMKKAFNTDI